MLPRRFVVFALALAAFAGVGRGQTLDVTGLWTGTITGPSSCTSGTVTQTLNLNLNLAQSGPNITGSGSVTGVDACDPTGNTTINTPINSVSATISGSQIDGTATIVGNKGPQTSNFQAAVSGNTMHFTIFTGTTTSAQGTLTKQAAPSVDVTGSWGGTFSAMEQCNSGGTVPWSSPVLLTLSQTGAQVTGNLLFYALAKISDQQCAVSGTQQVVLPVVGAVSGSTLNGSITTEKGAMAPFMASISGTTLTLSVPDKTTGSATLTRGSSTTIDTHLSGTYSGTFTATMIPCVGTPAQQAPITFSGTLAGSLTQTGSLISGLMTITGDKSDNQNGTTCTVADKAPSVTTFSGQISGNSISGAAFDAKGKVNPFSGTVIGSTISGNSPGENPGESFAFSVTKSGVAAAPPQILSFNATPPSIRAGQSATLSWTTSSATGVSIDNGVGNEAASGSITVSPAAKTTYTLTAAQGTQTTTATVTVDVLTAPIVNVTTIPATMLEIAGNTGAATAYALTNSGSASTSITLSQNGSFFSQSPSTFTLAAGATQTVTITAPPQAQGTYEGASIATGNGVSLNVPVKLVATPAPTGSVTADAAANRVDVAGVGTASPSGSVSFKNNGTAQLIGVLNSEVPWILPQSGTVTINPGQTGTFTFTIDRTQRPDAGAPVGSVDGNLTLTFFSGSGSSFAAKPLDNTTTVPSVSLVKIVDTVQPSVATGGIPALGTGEVALFIAGVGHVVGTGGAQFVSDVSILNPQGSKSVDDLKLYYTSTTGSATAAQTAPLPSVPGQVSVAVADVVKSVFSGTNERGSLQVRSKDADKITASAAVLTTNNPTGTYGNTIPVFRSDRAIATGDALVLTGLRKDATTHTNLYIQEAAGAPASVQTDFLAADGSALGTRTDPVDAFKLLALDNIVPANAVTALITNKSTAGGKIVAYATPLDEASGDTWAIADWSHQLGYSGSDAVIIPIAGSVHGTNNTFYRTDLSISNRGTDPATATLQYTSRTGTTAQQQISLAGKQTMTLADVISSFSVSGDTLGFLTLTPTSGSIAVTSRTFTTTGSKSATFGSGVPALAAASALHLGGTRAIAGLADAARSTVVAGKPSTYRTNFAVMETAGQPVTVRVTFRFTFPAGQKVQGTGAASRDYALNGNGFLFLNSIAGEILGPPRLQYGDLTNVEADFQVISGGGAVMLFTSSVDNASGDSILRTE